MKNRISYGQQWDGFYASLGAGGTGTALWDVEPGRAVACDYPLFAGHFAETLPIVDFGCGTGRQTAFLGRIHGRTTGLDVSSEAIRLARASCSQEGIDFLTIDEADPEYFRRIHARLGDAHVYMRGVLHQVRPEDVAQLVTALHTLLGVRGRLFFTEVSSTVRTYLTSESTRFSQLPGLMQRTLISRLPPRGLLLDDFPGIFPGNQFQVLDSGESQLNTNIVFGKEKPIRIPAVYGVMASRASL